MNNGIDIFLSDLSMMNSWPDQGKSLEMAQEAFLQANARATTEGRDTSDLGSKIILSRVRISLILTFQSFPVTMSI
jgi:hypothetical protein